MFKKMFMIAALFSAFFVNCFGCEREQNVHTKSLTLHDLPSELLANIADKVEWHDFASMRLTCKDMAACFFPLLHSVPVGRDTKLSDALPIDALKDSLFHDIQQAALFCEKTGRGVIDLDLSCNNFGSKDNVDSLKRILNCCASHDIPVHTLDLSENNISNVAEFVVHCIAWSQLKYIKVLDLSYNTIEPRLLDIIFRWMPQLEELVLDSMQLNALPESIGMLKNLKELYCEHNNIGELSECIGNLQSLKIFEVSCNPLKKGSLDLIGDVALQLEKLSIPSLGYVPESIKNLSLLQKLTLGYVYEGSGDACDPGIVTTEMLDCVGRSLLRLRVLELSRCPMFPPSMMRLKNLKTFKIDCAGHLSAAVLASVAGSLARLRSLKISYIADFPYPLPAACKQLKGLKKLAITRPCLPNAVRTEHLDWIAQVFPQLESLDLSALRVKTLPKSMRFLCSLQSLKLDGIKLSPRMVCSVCACLPNLRNLSMKGCCLHRLPREMERFQHMQSLSLENNNIPAEIIARVAQSLPRLCIYH